MTREEFGSFYQQYYDKFVRFCANRLIEVDEEQIKDVVQDIFVKAYASNVRLSKDAHELAILAWIYAIARNHIIDYHRRRSVMRNVIMSDVVVDESLTIEDPTDLYNSFIALSDVLQQIDGLSSKKQQQVMYLVADGYEYKDIAEKLQLPLNSIKMHVLRARQCMRRQEQAIAS
mgnify:CR=1 FL=1